MNKPFIVRVVQLFSLVVLSTACNSNPPKKTIDGVYESLGYGRVVKIENGEFLVADVTSKSCIPLLEVEVADLGEAIQFKNDTLTLQQGINTYYFIPIEDAPEICKKDTPAYKNAEALKNDPVYNFEILWETFTTHYAYFELRNVNPDSMYNAFRPRITSETSDVELFAILFEMLESFDDGHIGISAPDEIEEAGYALFEATQNVSDKMDTLTPKKRLRNNEVAKAVADTYIPEGTSIKNGNLRWGILENNIGYIQLNQMMGMADYKVSDTLSYRDYWMAYIEIADESENDDADEVMGLENSLNQIMDDFSKTNALIIDVRFNGGGKDEVGMTVLKRLNSQKKIAFTKKGKLNNGFTPLNRVIQEASESPYTEPVYLLTSVESASATEIMALSAMSIPTITKIGSKTEGVFSDILDKKLPNGWEFGLSSEVYQDTNGVNYEGIGIPPDVTIAYPRDTQQFLQTVLTDLKNGTDQAIERALQLTSKKI